MPVTAVVVDIGGVLEITEPRPLLDLWEPRFGLDRGELVERTRHVWRDGAVGAITEAQVHSALRALLDAEPALVDEFLADIWVDYLGTLNTGLYAFLRELRPRYRTGIISNSFVGAREREQELYRFDEITDVIVYSHEVGMEKPDPRIYRLACERLGVRPEEAVFLDDVPEAVEGARQVGMHGVVFQDNDQAVAAIEALLA